MSAGISGWQARQTKPVVSERLANFLLLAFGSIASGVKVEGDGINFD